MNITIESIKENEDGSADCNVELDAEAISFLLRKALVDCLTEAIDAGMKLKPPEEAEEISDSGGNQ